MITFIGEFIKSFINDYTSRKWLLVGMVLYGMYKLKIEGFTLGESELVAIAVITVTILAIQGIIDSRR